MDTICSPWDIFSIYFVDANNGYAVGWTKVLKTINGGANWTIQSSGISGTYDNLSSVFFLNANTGFTVGYKGRILKTTNGGGLGIAENNTSTSFTIYPNPADDMITINLEHSSHTIMNLNIYNVAGSLVKTLLLQQNEQKINVSDISKGIYIVEIKSEGWTEKQKLIIQR